MYKLNMDLKESKETTSKEDGLLLDEKNENQENAEKAERLFSDYLNIQKIPYYFIDQSKEKYSNEFKENKMQRPDFIIHTKYSIFYIDVKHRKKYYLDKDSEKCFYLNQNELNRLFKFQNELSTTVWIAFIDIENTTEFYFSSISEIFEYYTHIKNNMELKHPEMNDYFNMTECYKIKNCKDYIEELNQQIKDRNDLFNVLQLNYDTGSFIIICWEEDQGKEIDNRIDLNIEKIKNIDFSFCELVKYILYANL